MLSPIPRSILRDTLTLYVPEAFDAYQKPTAQKTYIVRNVHMQNDNAAHISGQNTEVTLRGVVFVDARHSVPRLDFERLQEQAQKAGGVMTCTVTNKRGGVSPLMTVAVVDGLPDDEGSLHHWEIGVV